jgi:hypothetical protein
MRLLSSLSVYRNGKVSKFALNLLDADTVTNVASESPDQISIFFDAFGKSFGTRLGAIVLGNLFSGLIFKQIVESFTNFGKNKEVKGGKRVEHDKDKDRTTSSSLSSIIPSSSSSTTIPVDQWFKLLLCLAIDLAGDSSFLLPGI